MIGFANLLVLAFFDHLNLSTPGGANVYPYLFYLHQLKGPVQDGFDDA